MIGICSPRQSESILLWLSLLFLLTATKFHRSSWKILNSDIQFPKHLTKGVPLSEKKRWKFSSSQPWESFSCSARRKAKCRAPASPPCQPWHTQPHYLPLVFIGFHSQGNAWELVIPSFASLLSPLLQSPACRGSGSLLMQMTQLKISPVVCPHYRLQHAPSTEQFIASLFPNRASANFIRVMDYVRKYISPIDSLFQRTHYLSHFL